jgi:hypothetical protein
VKKLVQRLTGRIVNEVCYQVCNHLEGYTGRHTTGTKLAAGDAIAVSWALAWKRALDEDDSKLPPGIANTLSVFSPEEWREVMSCAELSETWLEGDLKRPEWEHLRRKPVT